MPDRHHHHHHYRDGHDYARNAGRPGPGPNIHQLRRDTRRGKIAGVCAGLSNYFGWNLKWVRILSIVITVFMFPMPIFAYIIAAIMIKADDGRETYVDRETERFWRNFSTRPKTTFSELKHRFRALDMRIGDLESAVVSDEYGLRKEFRDLERGT